MPRALPIELRSRVVNAFNEVGGTLSDLAKSFNVSVSSVFRWVNLDKCYSDLSPKPPNGHRAYKIPNEDLEKLKSLVAEKPDRTVKEIAVEWNSRYGQSLGNAVMGRALLRAGLPFKKRLSAHLRETEKMWGARRQHFWMK